MESDWRFNVWEIGLAQSNIELAAYILTGPVAGRYLVKGRLPVINTHAGTAVDDPTFGYVVSTFPQPPGPFPWGFNVTPDT